MRLWYALAPAFCLALLCCTTQPTWRSATGYTWGTTYHITYQADSDLNDSIIQVMNEINESLSMFSTSSTVSRINRNEINVVDAHFEAVFELSLAVNIASNGRFDPSVAPLVDLWGFGREGNDTRLPVRAQVDSVLQYIGIDRCKIVDSQIIKGHHLMEFDFSAVAKGYGVDQVAEMLKRNGSNNFMVEIGGEIVLHGHNPSGKDWRIQIDAPVLGSQPGDSALSILNLSNCGIATSGNYRNFREGGEIGHTIDPASGYPFKSEILSSTVVAPTCALADALATALMASPRVSSDTILCRFPMAGAILVTPDSVLIKGNDAYFRGVQTCRKIVR